MMFAMIHRSGRSLVGPALQASAFATLALLSFATASQTARADLIQTFNFSDDTVWSQHIDSKPSTKDDPPPAHSAIRDGSSLILSQLSPGGRVVFTVTATSISTVGFTDIRLTFSHSSLSSGNALELNLNSAAGFGDATGDGFEILAAAQGFDFSTTDAGNPSPFRTQLLLGAQSWNSSQAASFSQSLIGDPSIDNSAITGLVIKMQVDDAGESFTLSNFQLTGTAIGAVAAVPEPMTAVPMGAVLMGLLLFAGRKKNSAIS